MAIGVLELRPMYDCLQQGYARAAAAAGECRELKQVAGTGLALRFAGAGLVPLVMPAFRHLAATRDGPGAVDAVLELSFWDSNGTGVGLDIDLPPAGPGASAYYLSPDLRLVVSAGGALCGMLDLRAGRAVVWARSADSIPGYERAAPARVLLHWWFAARGAQLIHAAAVARTSDAVLLVGPPGAGKSTTSLSCQRAGFEFVGDDYCLLTSAGEFAVHSLFGSAKLFPDNLRARAPWLAGAVCNQGELAAGSFDKAVLFTAANAGGAAAAGSGRRVRAVLLPQVAAGATSELQPVSGMQALKALAPSTLVQMPGLDQRALSDLARLVRTVPCFRLVLGDDGKPVADVVAQVWA